MGNRQNLLLGTALSTLSLWSLDASAQAQKPSIFSDRFYFGFSAGGAWTSKGQPDNTPWVFGPAQLPGLPAGAFGATSTTSGGGGNSGNFAGGIQAGYNLELNHFLMGVEVDVLGMSQASTASLAGSGTYSSTSVFPTSSVSSLLYITSSTSTTSTNFLTSIASISATATTGTLFPTSVVASPTVLTTGTAYLSTTVVGPTTTIVQGPNGPTTEIYNTTATTTTATIPLTSVSSVPVTITSTVYQTTVISGTVTVTTGTNYLTTVTTGTSTSTTTINFPTTTTSAAPFSVTSIGRASVDWVSTLRTRVGVTVDRTLFYATGGLAFGGVSQSYTTTINANGVPSVSSYSNHFMRAGYAIGGGVEYAFGPAWSARAQYVYYNLGTAKYTAPGNLSTLASSRLDGHIATFGVNYMFGGKP